MLSLRGPETHVHVDEFVYHDTLLGRRERQLHGWLALSEFRTHLVGGRVRDGEVTRTEDDPAFEFGHNGELAIVAVLLVIIRDPRVSHVAHADETRSLGRRFPAASQAVFAEEAELGADEDLLIDPLQVFVSATALEQGLEAILGSGVGRPDLVDDGDEVELDGFVDVHDGLSVVIETPCEIDVVVLKLFGCRMGKIGQEPSPLVD